MKEEIFKIQKYRSGREARRNINPKPLFAAIEVMADLDYLSNELNKNELTAKSQSILAKQKVSSIVSTMEIYFKDMMDEIFRRCSKDVFLDKLPKLHDKSYKISSLISQFENGINPLELIVNSQNFQNLGNIERVFGLLLGLNYRTELHKIKWRIKDEKFTESEFTKLDYENIQYLIKLRHEIIHNPKPNNNFDSENIEQLLDSFYGFFVASDLILCNFIVENLDEELKRS